MTEWFLSANSPAASYYNALTLILLARRNPEVLARRQGIAVSRGNGSMAIFGSVQYNLLWKVQAMFLWCQSWPWTRPCACGCGRDARTCTNSTIAMFRCIGSARGSTISYVKCESPVIRRAFEPRSAMPLVWCIPCETEGQPEGDPSGHSSSSTFNFHLNFI